MTAKTANGELVRPFDIGMLETGVPTAVRVDATQDELLAIAKRLDILAVHAFVAELNVFLDTAGDVNVYGELSGEVEQACVVTLDPVRESVETKIAQRYSRHPDQDEEDEEEDPLEPISDDEIELGEMLVQNFALALNPYPRQQGVEFDPVDDDDGVPSGPFAALAALRENSEKTDE